MQALRVIQKVSDDGYVHIKIPRDMGEQIELIILPLSSKENESMAYAQLQEKSGFVRETLGSESEDVWNDI